MAPKLHPNAGIRKKIDQWIDTLLFCKETPKNHELMMEYFFQRFIQNPREFYFFLQTLKTMLSSKITPLQKKRILAKKYLNCISVIAERFGFYRKKTMLDDDCFQIVHPAEYLLLLKKMKIFESQSKRVFQNIMKIIKKTLHQRGLNCRISGRKKTLYSIYKKMKKNPRKKFENFHDIFAFRILTPDDTISKCFEVLNTLHDMFYPSVEHFKDYITIPKINGYQSLHTGLLKICKDWDYIVEVQIRTPQMHAFAEYGLAAHWRYDIHKTSRLPNEKERKIVDHFSSLSQKPEAKNQIWAFSFEGDLFPFKKGSNLIDFAHRIHSSLRNLARRGLVNGQEKNLYYRIHDGDRIKIIA